MYKDKITALGRISSHVTQGPNSLHRTEQHYQTKLGTISTYACNFQENIEHQLTVTINPCSEIPHEISHAGKTRLKKKRFCNHPAYIALK
jgi:hypothetical protein